MQQTLTSRTIDLLEQAVAAIISGKRKKAQGHLSEIDTEELWKYRAAAFDSFSKKVRGTPSLPPSRVRSKAPSRDKQVIALRRDGFICRYAHCRERVLFLPTLRALCESFPDYWPYHTNWPHHLRHKSVFWVLGHSMDHLVPPGRGGTNDLSNVLTTCYLCNEVKKDRLIEEIGWQMAPPPKRSSWQGLSQYYVDLRRSTDLADSQYHREWMAAVQSCL